MSVWINKGTAFAENDRIMQSTSVTIVRNQPNPLTGWTQCDTVYNRFEDDWSKNMAGLVYKSSTLKALKSNLNIGSLIIFDGDSNTVGVDTNPYPNQLADLIYNDNYFLKINNLAAGGQSLATMESDAAATIDVLHSTTTKYLIAWGGVADLFNEPATSVADIIARAVTYCTNRVAVWGANKVIFLTMLPCPNNTRPTMEADRQTFNAGLKSNLPGLDVIVVDVAADMTIGQAGQNTNETYYAAADHRHILNPAAAIVANYVYNAIKIYY